MDKTLLCVTVTAPTTAELRRGRDRVADADLIELRLDTVSDPDVAGALAGRRRPVIVTCRPAWEGGSFHGSEDERKRILEEALAAGAEYVDVEWKAGFSDLIDRTGGRRIVLSSHDFGSTPPDLADRARAMRSTGAEIVKIATHAERLSDCLPLLDVGAAAGDRRLVLIAMGEYGLASRILARRFGSRWTYAGTLESVGQLTAEAMLDKYRFRSISESTRVFGLVGSPIAHSVSPAMHNAAFEAAAIDAVYVPLRADDAAEFVAFARAIGLEGASVTIPLKVALFAHVDEADPVARRIGAINTILVRDGRWVGGNTDAAAFLRPLQQRGLDPAGLRVAILGAGGAARGVAVALAPSGAAVTIYARDPERARLAAMAVGAAAAPWPPPAGAWDLLVNCTPLGTHPRHDESPLPAAALSGRLVYDLVYNPPTTRLLRDALTAGCAVLGGLEMLVAQAEEQFAWWTGTRAPQGVMRAAAEERLAEFRADENHVA